MLNPHSWHTATLLGDGKLLVTGSEYPNVPTNAEVYDPATDLWTATGAPSRNRVNARAVLLPSGKVLVTGGAKVGGGPMGSNQNGCTLSLLANGKVLVTGSVPTTELYDPVTNTWSPTGTIGKGRSSHTTTTLPSGKVLLVGTRKRRLR